MKADEERAREIVDAIDRTVGCVPEAEWPAFLGAVRSTICAALAEARREGRAEALREAAEVADEHAETCPSDLCCRDDAQPCDSHAQVIARSIRAFANPNPKPHSGDPT